MNPQATTPKIGDRVEITAAQSYDMTWDENGDRIVGEYGTLQDISVLAQKDNQATGTHDATPYEVRLDNGQTVWAADVMPETEGLRRTITYLDKGNDEKLKRIRDLETRIAELEESPLAWAENLDAKSLDNFLIALSTATEHEPMSGAIDEIHQLIRSYRRS